MKKIILYILIILIYSSCSPNLEYEIRGYSEKIIVEGYAESGTFPKVYLSLNVPLYVTPDSVNYLDYLIRNAKVTVSDGSESEVLTSGWDVYGFPPFSYKATKMKVVPGKNYELKVEYGGYTIISKTSVPVKTPITGIKVVDAPIEGYNILSLEIYLEKSKTSSFRIFTKKNSQPDFIECPVLYNRDLNLDGQQSWQILPGMIDVYSSEIAEAYFQKGDTVEIKLCEIDSISTQFFKELDAFSANGIATLNLIGERTELKSNISAPGFGIWCGAAVSYFKFIVP